MLWSVWFVRFRHINHSVNYTEADEAVGLWDLMQRHAELFWQIQYGFRLYFISHSQLKVSRQRLMPDSFCTLCEKSSRQ